MKLVTLQKYANWQQATNFVVYISYATKLVAINKAICRKSCTFLYTRGRCKAVYYTHSSDEKILIDC